MEIKATTPCYKFRDVKPEEQIAKLKEELAEVEEAYQRLKQNPNEYQKLVDLHMEIIDLKACCNTFVFQLRYRYRGVSMSHEFDAPQEAIRRVIAKRPEDIICSRKILRIWTLINHNRFEVI